MEYSVAHSNKAIKYYIKQMIISFVLLAALTGLTGGMIYIRNFISIEENYVLYRFATVSIWFGIIVFPVEIIEGVIAFFVRSKKLKKSYLKYNEEIIYGDNYFLRKHKLLGLVVEKSEIKFDLADIKTIEVIDGNICINGNEACYSNAVDAEEHVQRLRELIENAKRVKWQKDYQRYSGDVQVNQ